MSADDVAALRRQTALDHALATAAVLLSLAALPALAVTGLQIRVTSPSADLILDALTAVVSIAVAALSRVRYEERREPVALFQAAAFLVLSLANGLAVALVGLGLDARGGMSLAAPTQAPLYVYTLAHLLAGGLLVIGGVGSLRRNRAHSPTLVLGATALLTISLMGACEIAAPLLPPLVSLPPLASLPGSLPAPTSLGAAAQVVTAALFLWASGLSRRLYRRDGALADGYLAVGLVFAAFAQFETALYPGTYTGLVTSADILRLAFDLLLVAGIEAEARATLRSLRRANEELDALRAAEVEHAAIAERSRVARELHDGVAQNLWLAKLKVRRLAALPAMDAEATTLTDELAGAIDAGLAEAHEAVAALRLSDGRAGTLADLLRRLCDDFADRYGVRVEYMAQADLPQLSPRAQAECLRVAHEALANVQRHADATLVRVSASAGSGRLIVTVSDNGRGFDPGAGTDRAFGLSSMRERAGLLGGELLVESQPQAGTRVRLHVPLDSAAAVPGGAA